ncbi:hypothetical protein OF83DRAFT_1139893 [Amylostereum chailletii]|nr:hypothetical protein OF83DRAFT_1139893 [Amylostereum chailletii]
MHILLSLPLAIFHNLNIVFPHCTMVEPSSYQKTGGRSRGSSLSPALSSPKLGPTLLKGVELPSLSGYLIMSRGSRHVQSSSSPPRVPSGFPSGSSLQARRGRESALARLSKDWDSGKRLRLLTKNNSLLRTMKFWTAFCA